jgi:hypothetical protein
LNSLGKEKAEDIVENDLNQKGGKEKKLGGSGEKRKKKEESRMVFIPGRI